MDLRCAGALFVSFVAERGTQVVGYIAFSPIEISDGSEHWYGLSPVAVLPELQHQGIGKALINSGLSALPALGAAGCVVLGEYFQSLTFGQYSAMGKVTYHEAFGIAHST